MSTITWNAEFSAITCYNNVLDPVNFNISISFDDETSQSDDQTTAFGRIRHLIKDLYQDAVFIWLGNPTLPLLHKKFDNKIVTLPFAPTNYSIGVATWYKILSMTQGRITLTGVSFGCDKSDNISINVDHDMATEDDLIAEMDMKNWNKPAWWFRSTPTTYDVLYKKQGKHVMEYHEADWPEWLQWDQEEETKTKKNKKQESNVIPLKKNWKPEVIKGDKN